MRLRRIALLTLGLLLAGPALVAAEGQLALGTPFTHHAVLQRELPLPIWGWAAPGEPLVVALGEFEHAVVADEQGRWRIELPPQPAGGPHRLRVTGQRRSVVVNDVLIGEVWLCAGQSNMQWPVRRTDHAAAERAAAAAGPPIRFLRMPDHAAPDPLAFSPAEWQRASPQAVDGWSAVAWGFARRLHAELDVPIGIIQADWDDTRIESWLPASAAERDPAFAAAVAADEAGPRQQLRLARANTAFMSRWRAVATSDGQRAVDPGRQPRAWNWHHDEVPEQGWGLIPVPGNWEDHGLSLDGAVWLRRRVTIPSDWAERALILELGPVDDHDRTWFAGHEIGATGPESEAAWSVARRYRIPARHVSPGEHSIALRVWDDWGNGGLGGEPEHLRLYPHDEPEAAIALAGEWRFRIELAVPEDRFDLDRANQQTAVLYNGMIAPVLDTGLRGVCWYQGESNAGNPDRYRDLLPLLVQSWRRAAERELPFLVVQLPRFGEDRSDPARWSWALIRDAQTSVLALPATELVVTIDTGESDNVHPTDKRAVAERLTFAALRGVYAHDDAPRPPRAHEVEAGEGSLRVHLTGAEGLTTTDGQAPRAFYLAGRNRRWHPAEARIDGESIILTSPAVPEPIAVRYAWTAAPDVNLIDADGLPLAPFRSDSW